MERGSGGEARRTTWLLRMAPPLHLWRGGWGVRFQRAEEQLLRGTPYDGRTAFESKAEQPANMRSFLCAQDAAKSGQMRPDHISNGNRFDRTPANLSFHLSAGSEAVDDLTPQPPLHKRRGGVRTGRRGRNRSLT